MVLAIDVFLQYARQIAPLALEVFIHPKALEIFLTSPACCVSNFANLIAPKVGLRVTSNCVAEILDSDCVEDTRRVLFLRVR